MLERREEMLNACNNGLVVYFPRAIKEAMNRSCFSVIIPRSIGLTFSLTASTNLPALAFCQAFVKPKAIHSFAVPPCKRAALLAITQASFITNAFIFIFPFRFLLDYILIHMN